MIVKQHIPSSMEIGDPIKVEVETLGCLLGQEFIRRFQQVPEFHRFSIERGYFPPEDLSLLMAEYEEGRVWWVVAKIQGDIAPLAELPDFQAKGRETTT